MSTPGPHILYRLFDAHGDLLYIGITNDINLRFYSHRNSKPWWPEVSSHSADSDFKSRWDLEAAECEAIRTECPKYNTMYNEHRFDRTPTPLSPEVVEAFKNVRTSLFGSAS